MKESEMKSMTPYLQESEFVDFSHPDVYRLSVQLAQGLDDDTAIAKRCFEFVRDDIRHSGDFKDDITTCKASEVLEYQTGWCYAKAILLAALMRANGIPAAFCYQRLSCSEYEDETYCLHGLNAVWLKTYGWYKIDARGNKEGVDARFTPPVEQLAFIPEKNEYNIDERFAEPLPEVIAALRKNRCYSEMTVNFPDIKPF